MLVEILYTNGHKERVISSPAQTLVGFVRDAEDRNNAKIKTVRIVKRNVAAGNTVDWSNRDPHR